MITYVRGDLFTSPAEVLVNTVNTVGVMGKGVANEFKRIFPEMFKLYQAQCESGALDIGSLFLYQSPHKAVLNFPTKKHWRSPSRIEYIERDLQTFVDSYAKYGFESVAFPQLGCGNGELDWETEVRSIMEGYLADFPIRVFIHIYDSHGLLPEHHDHKWIKRWLREEPENLPAMEVWDDLLGVAAAVTEIDGWQLDVGVESVSLEDESNQMTESSVSAIRFEKDGNGYSLTEDELQPLWRKLRVFGFLSSNDLAPAARFFGAPVIALLERLEYLVATSFSEGRTRSAPAVDLVEGVKLVPRASKTQRLLIEA